MQYIKLNELTVDRQVYPGYFFVRTQFRPV